jgi:hypothetical protein
MNYIKKITNSSWLKVARLNRAGQAKSSLFGSVFKLNPSKSLFMSNLVMAS